MRHDCGWLEILSCKAEVSQCFCFVVCKVCLRIDLKVNCSHSLLVQSPETGQGAASASQLHLTCSLKQLTLFAQYGIDCNT